MAKNAPPTSIKGAQAAATSAYDYLLSKGYSEAEAKEHLEAALAGDKRSGKVGKEALRAAGLSKNQIRALSASGQTSRSLMFRTVSEMGDRLIREKSTEFDTSAFGMSADQQYLLALAAQRARSDAPSLAAMQARRERDALLGSALASQYGGANRALGLRSAGSGLSRQGLSIAQKAGLQRASEQQAAQKNLAEQIMRQKGADLELQKMINERSLGLFQAEARLEQARRQRAADRKAALTGALLTAGTMGLSRMLPSAGDSDIGVDPASAQLETATGPGTFQS